MDEEYLPEKEKKYSALKSKPVIAGILLIIAGLVSLMTWIPVLFIDQGTVESLIDLSEFQVIDADITIEQIKGFLSICATISILLSLFPILGGILSFKRKLWGLCVAFSVIGLSVFIPFILPGVIVVAALILLIVSKDEF